MTEMFYLVTQRGQIPSWKIKWGVVGGFHFFFFWGVAEAKNRREFFYVCYEVLEHKRNLHDIFSPPVLTGMHTVSKCLTTTALENKFISAPLGFSWRHTAEEYEYKLLGVKINQLFASRWWSVDISCCDAQKKKKSSISSQTLTNRFCPFPARLPKFSSHFSASLHVYSMLLLFKAVTSRYKTLIFQYAVLCQRTCLHLFQLRLCSAASA